MTIDEELRTGTEASSPDPAAVGAFAQQLAGVVIGTATAAMVALGDALGLYATLAASGPVTPDEFAARSGTHERYVREWLAQQTAAGVLAHDPAAGTFELPAAHAAVLASDDSPVAMAGAAQQMVGIFRGLDQVAEGFRTGGGIAWGDHDPAIFAGSERFWATQYRTHLLTSWLPAVPGLQDRLSSGATVVDVGCGHGASTILMAGAFSASRFVGYDVHEASIDVARQRAQAAGVSDRVDFEVNFCQGYPAEDYDLITFFDAFHDVGDPVGSARHARKALAADGSLLLIEPVAADDLATNVATNPAAPLGYAMSTVLCVANSLSQPVGLALGAQAGPARLTEVLTEAGFAQVDIVARSDFNLVIHARP